MLRRHKKVLDIFLPVELLIQIIILTEPSCDADNNSCESEERDPEDEIGFHTLVCRLYISFQVLFQLYDTPTR